MITAISCLRFYLSDLVVQANAHELFAKKLRKDTKKLDDKVRDVIEQVETYKKETDKHEEELCKSFNDLDNAKQQYDEIQNEKDNFDAKLQDLGRPEQIDKEQYLKEKGIGSESAYKKQIINSNKVQEEFYHQLIPGVLNQLEKLANDTNNFVNSLVTQCLQADREMNVRRPCYKDSHESTIGLIETKNYSNKVLKR